MSRRLLLALAALAALPAGAENPTTERELAPTGSGMYGDRCSTTADCGFPGAVCASPDKRCTCHPEHPATNHIDKCGPAVGVNESCIFNEQCQEQVEKTECRSGRCACLYEMIAELDASGTTVCVSRNDPIESTTHLDPAMIGVLVGMALMFVIICVVLRLFSRARWSENRTIFNTPNPRLMNVSLLKDSKLLHAQDGRRGSRASMRAPSRQASQQELRTHSPQGSRRGSRASSNVSAASTRSSKSPTGHTQTNHSSTVPMLENVTIEVQELKA